jgi:hypothetical protein
VASKERTMVEERTNQRMNKELGAKTNVENAGKG